MEDDCTGSQGPLRTVALEEEEVEKGEEEEEEILLYYCNSIFILPFQHSFTSSRILRTDLLLSTFIAIAFFKQMILILM
jgi:hypothetical protein